MSRSSQFGLNCAGRIILLAVTFISGTFNATAQSVVTTKSPNGGYAVTFSDPRSDTGDAGRLWGKITIRNLQTGGERTARVAQGQRGQGNFQGFSLYDQGDAWSPDELYLAFWSDYCQDERAVPTGVVCHLHELHFLSMRENICREELSLGRYSFAGWARNQPHTALEILINEDGRTVRRSPCALK